MYALMSRQITEPSERLPTDVTTVRFLICVSAAVSRQITEVIKRLSTDVTTVRLSGLYVCVDESSDY